MKRFRSKITFQVFVKCCFLVKKQKLKSQVKYHDCGFCKVKKVELHLSTHS